MTAYFGGNDLIILPEKLRHYRNGLGEVIPSNSNVRVWNGYLISYNLADTNISWAEMDFGLKWSHDRAFATAFNGEDGKEYVYILPHRNMSCNYLDNPKEIIFSYKNDEED